jgi:NAD+ kinase
MRYVIISRLDDERVLDYTAQLVDFLVSEGNEVVLEQGTAEALGRDGIAFADLTGDIAVVIGGDGSVLLAVQQLRHQIPIIGINWGEVGFLTELEPGEAQEFFRTLRKPDIHVENRMRIAISADGQRIGDALNEGVIVTTRPSKMLRFSIMVDGIQAEQFRADGLLISTPTGSTAYAMSAGGPIIDPRIEGFLIVPLAPYMLSSRPHLISRDRRLQIRLESMKPAHLVLDGQKTIPLKNGTVLTVEMSGEPARFVDIGSNFFLKVDSKLRRL